MTDIGKSHAEVLRLREEMRQLIRMLDEQGIRMSLARSFLLTTLRGSGHRYGDFGIEAMIGDAGW